MLFLLWYNSVHKLVKLISSGVSTLRGRPGTVVLGTLMIHQGKRVDKTRLEFP